MLRRRQVFFLRNRDFVNSRHYICRIRTLSSSTQPSSVDTLSYSTRRFDPFFCRIMCVLTVDNKAQFEGKLTFGKILAKKVENCTYLERDYTYLIVRFLNS